MAMMNTKDKPTYYNLVDSSGKIILAKVAKYKVQKLIGVYRREMGIDLKSELIKE